MSRAPQRRKPSASPVCYADEKGIAPGYMWAEPPKAKPTAKKRVSAATKPRKTSGRKSAER